MHTDEPKKLIVNAKGPKDVTAADIETDSEVEIVNPDLHIATLDKTANLYMEIMLEKGRGYVLADKNKDPNMPIGVIPMDSLFTPVTKVNFAVENTRVGQITDFDKLTLEVWTNGSVNADEATSPCRKDRERISCAVHQPDGPRKRRRNHGRKRRRQKEKILEITIEELDLSVRSYNCLKRAGSIQWKNSLCATKKK